MNTSELIKSVADRAGITQEAAKTAVESVVATMASTLASGDDVKLTNFGSFNVKVTEARQGRNPRTGESLMIAAGRKISFKPSSELKKNL